MKLKFSKNISTRAKSRLKNKVRIRKKISGTEERPRLSIYRSCHHMYAQVIDDVTGSTLVATSTLKVKGDFGLSSCEAAKQVGAEVAKLAKEKNINKVVFDRSGYVYHGRVKALADGAREAGLNF